MTDHRMLTNCSWSSYLIYFNANAPVVNGLASSMYSSLARIHIIGHLTQIASSP